MKLQKNALSAMISVIMVAMSIGSYEYKCDTADPSCGEVNEECDQSLYGTWISNTYAAAAAGGDCAGTLQIHLVCGEIKEGSQAPCILYGDGTVSHDSAPTTSYTYTDLIGGSGYLPVLCVLDAFGDPSCTIYDSTKTNILGTLEGDFSFSDTEFSAVIQENGSLTPTKDGQGGLCAHLVYMDMTFTHQGTNGDEVLASNTWSDLDDCVETVEETGDTGDTGSSEDESKTSDPEDEFEDYIAAFLVDWHTFDNAPPEAKVSQRMELVDQTLITWASWIPDSEVPWIKHKAYRVIRLEGYNPEASEQINQAIKDFEEYEITSVKLSQRLRTILWRFKPEPQD